MRKPKDNRPPKEQRTLKRGDVRRDGMIFWGYYPRMKDGEYWKKPELYEECNARTIKLSKANHLKNIDRRHELSKENRIKNREKLAIRSLKYRIANRERLAIASKKRRDNAGMGFRIKQNLRRRICLAVNEQGTMKVDTSMNLCGCSADGLKAHIASQFTSGMSWDNYGLHGWHIDHIKPCAKFDLTLDSEQRACFHYTNLQPLWAKDNWSKGDKYVDD